MLGTHVLREGNREEYYLQALKVRSLIIKDFEKPLKSRPIDFTNVSSLPFNLASKVENPKEMYEADLFTVPVNLAGLTAISVPLYNDITLPIGLQIIGDKFREEDVLKFGLAIERLVK